MKMIISPAKKMRVDTDSMETVGVPVYVKETGRLLEVLRGYSLGELQKLFAANEDITRLNYERYQDMNLEERLTPAVLSYVGIQYQSMAPGVFTSEQWEYVNRHLRILSGFYGILNACDGVVPYRLEMQAKLPVDGCRDLYEFWGDRLYRELVKEDQVIINLASKEYSKAVEPYIEKDVTFLTCVFAEEQAGKPKVKATAAKIARGTMVRWLAEHQVQDVEKIKEFDEGGYRYCGEMSGEREWVFLKNNDLL